jgi:hypothetical protein
MVSHFHRQVTVTARQAPPPAPDPLLALLVSLRTRRVSVLIGDRWLAGRLLTVDPLVLVGEDGQAVVPAPGEIQSVQF